MLFRSRRSRTSGHRPGFRPTGCDVDVWFSGGRCVLRSYQQHSRDRPSKTRDLAYFDIIAALATPPDMQLWHDLAAGQGRPDLSAEVLVARRHAFLERAIYRLGRVEEIS